MQSTTGRSARSRLLWAFLALMVALLPVASVQAQSNGPYRAPSIRAPQAFEGANLPPDAQPGLPPGYVPPGKLIVDTDTGVDDAAALAWLMTQSEQVDLLGVVTVAGNTTVENATENVATLLMSAGWPLEEWPVVLTGAAKPQNRKLSSTGKLIHGTDGLGYMRFALANVFSNAGKGKALKDVTAFYCSHAPSGPEADPVTILALGPLTNIAESIKKCPNEMRRYHYVVLGGNRGLGNQTPSAEYNFWQDPDSAQRVFSAGIEQLIIVPTDAFGQFALTLEDAYLLLDPTQTPLAQVIGGALAYYIGVLSLGDPSLPVSVPDPTAAMVAVFPQNFAPYDPYGYGAISEGLVKVNKGPEPEYLRGTSTIGIYAYNEPLTMIAKDKELSALYDRLLDGVTTAEEAFGKVSEWQAAVMELYAQEGPNAQVVLYPDGAAMRACFLGAFGVAGYESACPAPFVAEAGAATSISGEAGEPDLFLPILTAE